MEVALTAVSREADWKWAITSEDEWYKAAYHKNDGVTGNYWEYPTESENAPTAELPPGGDLTNGSANYNDIDIAYYINVVGSYDTIVLDEYVSDSPYDTFDQGGNVWEWTEAIVLSNGACRGGSGGSTSIHLSASNRTPWNRDTEIDGIGFRVVHVPEPGTITLLLCGLASLALLRRRR